jgi:hypothetical protein
MNRARKSALCKVPHLRSSPLQGEGKKESASLCIGLVAGTGKKDPGFFAAAALNDTKMGD